MSTPAKIILSFCALVVVLHVWSALAPMHENWGLHLFAFYDAPVGIAALLCLLAAAVPAIQTATADAVEKLFRLASRLPLVIALLIPAAIVFLLIDLFPARLHLLGDGAILLRSATLGLGSSEISRSFRNQPLMFWIYRWAMNLYPVDATPDSYTVYLSLDILGSILFLLLLAWFLRRIERPLSEKIYLGLLLFFGAGSQMFFGYIENYALQYVASIAYVIIGWFALEQKVPIVAPVLCLLLLVALHLGNIVFWPSLILLLLFHWRKNLRRSALIIGAIHVAGALMLYFIGFSMVDMTRHLTAGSVDFLQLFSATTGNFPYPMFSTAHLIDWLNTILLMSPVAVAAAAVLFFTLPRESRLKNPPLLFILATVACGCTFTWVINSALGLARDWDLFAGFIAPMLVLLVYLIINTTLLQPRRYVLVLLVVVSGLHWAAWIGINASAEKHLARMKTLDSPRLLSLAARMAYDESIANFSFDTKNYRDARVYYEDFMKIDSTNPRIIGNIADVYRFLGEKDLYFGELKRAAGLNSPDAGVYSNLGVEYAVRGDTNRAIELNREAIRKNATMKMAYANLGILYSGRRDYFTADKYFTTAISLGMREPPLFRYAGDACVAIGDYRRAIQDYDRYLSAVPNDPVVQKIRQRVYAEIVRLKK
jgi:Tfp pilus assembly protein PilF